MTNAAAEVGRDVVRRLFICSHRVRCRPSEVVMQHAAQAVVGCQADILTDLCAEFAPNLFMTRRGR